MLFYKWTTYIKWQFEIAGIFFPGIICWKRASFFNGWGAGVIIQCGKASFLDRVLHFCLLWWRSEFKKIPTVRVMLPARGNPTVGTKRLMYKSFALIFRFNCVHLLKYLCSNNKKKVLRYFISIGKMQFSIKTVVLLKDISK